MRALLLAFMATLAGCPSPDPIHGLTATQPPSQVLDYNEFVCNVEPVLIRRCSYLGCHGNVDHALRVYSPGKLRLADAPTRKARDAQLSPAEVQLNFESATGTVYASTADDRATPNDRVPLLSKPVAARVGGSEHHGVGIFPVPPAQDLAHDAEWTALQLWVGGKKQPSPVDAGCAAFFLKMGLQPK